MTAPVLTKEMAARLEKYGTGDLAHPHLTLNAIRAIAAGQTRVIHAPSAGLVERCKEALAADYLPTSGAIQLAGCIRDLLALIGETP